MPIHYGSACPGLRRLSCGRSVSSMEMDSWTADDRGALDASLNEKDVEWPT